MPPATLESREERRRQLAKFGCRCAAGDEHAPNIVFCRARLDARAQLCRDQILDGCEPFGRVARARSEAGERWRLFRRLENGDRIKAAIHGNGLQ